MYFVIFKYGAALVCLEFFYIIITIAIHLFASIVNQKIGGESHKFMPYFAAFLSGVLSIYFSLSLVKNFFSDIKLKLLITICYSILGFIMFVLFTIYLVFGMADNAEPSVALLQIFVSVILAWVLTENTNLLLHKKK